MLCTVSTHDGEEILRKLERAIKTDVLSKRCLKGTREDKLQAMHGWLMDLQGPNMLWLSAYPGAGKSTIVAHFANQLRKLHRACIIYPFNRNVFSKSVDLWCSMAYQIAQTSTICRKIVAKKLREGTINPDFATAEEVFMELVIDPLQHLAKSDPLVPLDDLPVFIIDALDECGGLSGPSIRSARKDVMSQIAQWATSVPQFKLIITSRPEGDITQLFSRLSYFPLDIQTGDSDSLESVQDVTTYVRYRFETMFVESPPLDWPTEDAILDLAQRSSGIFIWAVTALDFIEQHDPVNRLRKVRDGEVTLGGVNALYYQILDASFPDNDSVSDFVKLMSVVIVAQRFLSPTDYASLLNMDAHTVRSICGKLRSVLESGNVLQVKHASFVDFLVMGEGSSDTRFRVDPTDGHRLVAESAFRIMNKELHFNICKMTSSFLFNDAVGVAHFQQAIGPVLAYACQFWGHHIEHLSTWSDVPAIEYFMRFHFVFWLEAMSGLGRSYFAFRSLIALQKVNYVVC